jgi:hypothetical protein
VDRDEIVNRFNTLYLGDSLLQEISVETGSAQCRLRFSAGSVLKKGGTIFDPELRFEPALLRLHAVKSIQCEGGPYRLNSTVVDFGAAPTDHDDLIEFSFDMTGGTDPESFLVKVTIRAEDFDFAAVETTDHQ